MDADQAYMAAFLITGSHVDAELARARNVPGRCGLLVPKLVEKF